VLLELPFRLALTTWFTNSLASNGDDDNNGDYDNGYGNGDYDNGYDDESTWH
jgi:hypothetical protein